MKTLIKKWNDYKKYLEDNPTKTTFVNYAHTTQKEIRTEGYISVRPDFIGFMEWLETGKLEYIETSKERSD